MYGTQRLYITYHFVACMVTVIFVPSCLTHYYIIPLSCPRSDIQYLHTSISGGSLHSKCIPSRHIEKCTCSHKSKMGVCSYEMLTPVDTHPVMREPMGAQIRTGCYIHKYIQQHVVIKTASKLLYYRSNWICCCTVQTQYIWVICKLLMRQYRK